MLIFIQIWKMDSLIVWYFDKKIIIKNYNFINTIFNYFKM